MKSDNAFVLAGHRVKPGERTDIFLQVSETYTGDAVRMPIHIIRGREKGPTVFVTAAIHGDEINGTGIIHDFLFSDNLILRAGTLILIPVVNVFGFESNVRYLPDRRDLNRSFPGSRTGSLASRLAYVMMHQIVSVSNLGIDLHSAASQRTNYPNVRGDMSNPRVKELAKAFGCALMVNGKGPIGSFRKEATRRGCPTIILEAGEPFKIEPSVLEIGVQGIRNCLVHYGMLEGSVQPPPFQAIIRETGWLRAKVAGILKFHVAPGAFVEKGQSIATNYSILGKEQNTLKARSNGIILGMTTMPAVKPGEPICHIARLTAAQLTEFQSKLKLARKDPHNLATRHLATNMDVVKP